MKTRDMNSVGNWEEPDVSETDSIHHQELMSDTNWSMFIIPETSELYSVWTWRRLGHYFEVPSNHLSKGTEVNTEDPDINVSCSQLSRLVLFQNQFLKVL